MATLGLVKKSEVFKSWLRKTKLSRAVQKNEVFQEKFWVTFSKVTIRHGDLLARAAGTERFARRAVCDSCTARV
ncbi:MAG: hypothetical protein RSA94_01715, partial [Mucinivorans sp.]